MKIICVNNIINSTKKPYFYLKPDSCLVRNNTNIYIPFIANKMKVSFGILVKVIKIGKTINENFANNYYEEIAIANNYEIDLTDKHKTEVFDFQLERAIDNSLAVSSFFNKNDIINKPLSFSINESTIVKEIEISANIVNKSIEFVSQFLTFKIGDLLYIDIADYYKSVEINDRINSYLSNKIAQDYTIK